MEATAVPHFTVLASGSSANASLLEAAGFGLLIDFGLGPRQLTTRLTQVGRSWRAVRAAILTHMHSDHWNTRTLATLRERRIPLYCHGAHLADLYDECPAGLVQALAEAKLIRAYSEGQPFAIGAIVCQPLPVRHDRGATFGFRFSGGAGLLHSAWSLGYAADLGSWDDRLAAALCDVDLLALEFNHDVPMQRSSGRHPSLIARVLGDEGHLSNEQATELLRATLRRSPPGRLRQIVQLHLSRQCNRPSLAIDSARALLDELGLSIAVHAAAQNPRAPRSHSAPPPRAPH